MQVCCPCCNTEFPIEAGFAEADGKRLAAVLAALEPTVGRALIGYLRLFKPPKTALRMARAVKFASEVTALISTGDVCRDERGGVRRQAIPALWAQGMEQMAAQRDRLTLPLDGHGYLRAVVFGLADQADAVVERTREEHLRRGDRPTVKGKAGESPIEAAIGYANHMLDLGQWAKDQAGEFIDKARSGTP